MDSAFHVFWSSKSAWLVDLLSSKQPNIGSLDSDMNSKKQRPWNQTDKVQYFIFLLHSLCSSAPEFLYDFLIISISASILIVFMGHFSNLIKLLFSVVLLLNGFP